MKKQKQPASESLQKWLLFASTMILGAIAYQNQQITTVLSTLAALTERVENHQHHIDAIVRDIERLEDWRNSDPFRRDKNAAEMPKVFLLPDRRFAHLPEKPNTNKGEF